jgi:hydrogenase-4 component F
VAPLIFDRHDRRSLEAVWKYLVLSSVGIALALLGVFFLATSQPSDAGLPLVFDDLLRHAPQLDRAWLRGAFVFMVVGYGTKMGLAPMHSWKPDTYGEAPGLVAGLMAGALTSCAFLALARITAICYAANLGPFVRPVLIGFGVASLVIAAAFIVGQADVRRMLAYSSVEHMGLLVLGLGLGGVGAYGAVLHTLNHGLTKGLMFLAIGNVVMASGTSTAASVRGLRRTMPGTALLLIAGLFALTGSPPFGLFLSEFAILRAAFATHHALLACLVLGLLAMIFVGMAAMLLDVVYAPAALPAAEALDALPPPPGVRERRWFLVAPAVLATLVLILGLYIPTSLATALRGAAESLGGAAP